MPVIVNARWHALLPGLALLAGAGTGGCALAGDPCAAPITGTATYVSGSTPPPYHGEWTVRLEEAAGTLTFSPGYGSPLARSGTFVARGEPAGAACRRPRHDRDGDTPTGGGTLTVRWRADSGRSTRLVTSDQQAVAVVRTAVPATAWEQAEGAYEVWQQTQRR